MTEAERERAAVVTHLMGLASDRSAFGDDDTATWFEIAADHIRDGDHIKDTQP